MKVEITINNGGAKNEKVSIEGSLEAITEVLHALNNAMEVK